MSNTTKATVTEIFVLAMKDTANVSAIRERARKDFLSLHGVNSWKTYVTTSPDKRTLFAEIYEFPDEETAFRVSPLFAEREATKVFLAEVDDIIVGQYFVEHQPKELNNHE